jgi:hypothetical protein
MESNDGPADALFRSAVQGLMNGDFSRLEPLFTRDAHGGPQVVRWHQEGRFRDEPHALAEAMTCACFLGLTDVAEYLLKNSVDASGGVGTGLNAFHWAANRGQVDVVRLLLRWNAPLGARSMYGGNVLDTVVWSAVNEPRPGQLEVIEQLLASGARLEHEPYPTGSADVDAILRRRPLQLSSGAMTIRSWFVALAAAAATSAAVTALTVAIGRAFGRDAVMASGEERVIGFTVATLAILLIVHTPVLAILARMRRWRPARMWVSAGSVILIFLVLMLVPIIETGSLMPVAWNVQGWIDRPAEFTTDWLPFFASAAVFGASAWKPQ